MFKETDIPTCIHILQQTNHKAFMTLKGVSCLPVIIIISKETTSRHINILLLFFLFLLLLLLLLSSFTFSSSGSYLSNTLISYTSDRSSSTTARLQQKLTNVLLTKILGEQHRPVGLNSVVGSLQHLFTHFNTQTTQPSQS